jgi:hypothetical protein
MKYIFSILCFVVVLTSCEADDPKIITIQNASVVSVSLPDTLVFQQTEIFNVDYISPTTCHTFERFEVLGADQIKTIRTETRFEENFNCQNTPTNVETAQLDFFVESLDNYTFRFLSGASDTGQLQYIIVEVPVKQE